MTPLEAEKMVAVTGAEVTSAVLQSTVEKSLLIAYVREACSGGYSAETQKRHLSDLEQPYLADTTGSFFGFFEMTIFSIERSGCG